MITQLLPTTSLGNEWGQKMRIQILILGFQGLKPLANSIRHCKRHGCALLLPITLVFPLGV